MKYVAALAILAVVIPGTMEAQVSLNMSLFGHLNPEPNHYSGSWGWTSPTGEEYALLGGFERTHIVSIDDSLDIHVAAFVEGPGNNWREITVIGNHAFVVTEGSGDLEGMQVIDLSYLPDSVHLVTTYTETFTRGHIIMRDISVDSAFVYVSGTTTTGGVHILDVSDPSDPVQVGIYDPPHYIHDAHIYGNTLVASALGEGFDIVDISSKSDPVLLSRIEYPLQFTHSAWITEDLDHLVVTDESVGLPARIWNITDLQNPYEVSTYSADLGTIVHNPYVLGDLVFFAHNHAGIRVVDIDDPALPVEVGYYDTYPGPNGGSHGLWSAYPYFPSGKIIGGNREDGLYVWTFSGTRAGRFYGVVTDAFSGDSLSGATVSIIGVDETATDENGLFALGALPSPTEGYTVTASFREYVPDTLFGVVLNGGDSTWLEFSLSPSVTSVEEFDGPRETKLLQNHPNPFNPTTEIGYRIRETEHVTLRIYDLLGREVASLVNEQQTPGSYSTMWDATDMASGVYLYRLEAGDFAGTRKLLLLK